VLTKFSFHASHTVLLWFCVMVMLRLLSRALVFLAFPPSPPLLLFALNLPCKLAAVADALLGMVNSYLLLLLLLGNESAFRSQHCETDPRKCACARTRPGHSFSTLRRKISRIKPIRYVLVLPLGPFPSRPRWAIRRPSQHVIVLHQASAHTTE
jgi:hypothetical protein